MNFKKLVQKVNLNAGLQGSVITVTATDYQEYLAEAVRTAWMDLQNQREDWKFMWETTTFSTTPGTHEYSNADIMAGDGNAWGVAKWKTDSIFKNTDKLIEVEWQTYRDSQAGYEAENNSNKFSIREFRPAGLMIPTPTIAASIQADYYRTAQDLESNTDVPLLPEEFHYIIVYRALEDVLTFFGNRGLYERHSYKHDLLENKLMRSQVPAKKAKKTPLYRKRINRY